MEQNKSTWVSVNERNPTQLKVMFKGSTGAIYKGVYSKDSNTFYPYDLNEIKAPPVTHWKPINI